MKTVPFYGDLFKNDFDFFAIGNLGKLREIVETACYGKNDLIYKIAMISRHAIRSRLLGKATLSQL
jgi:hypothetical protein